MIHILSAHARGNIVCDCQSVHRKKNKVKQRKIKKNSIIESNSQGYIKRHTKIGNSLMAK